MSNQKDLYLKCRPSQIDDIIGQRYVVATLKQASILKRFAHAYLFSGNHGCGKTSTARILASLIQCEKVADGKVCGVCRTCKNIHEGVCLDVKELDGAVNRGIDKVKAIIESVQWSPQECNNTVVIIDEVHQLSSDAMSALLKTLEEPPSYLTFILCTTEIGKISGTILSRCQRFNFTKINSKDISQRLALISKDEKINIDEDAIHIISKISRGSMRDAIGYLQQIGTVAAGKNINAIVVQKYFGVNDRQSILNIIKSIVNGEIPLILDQVNDLMMSSADCKQILVEISEMLRDIMVIKAQNGSTKNIDLPDSEIKEFIKISEALSLSQLLKLAQAFGDVEKKITYNINERWITEATLINCISILREQ
jgi:DNA polymerase-3 subunit gamma/tau